MTSDTDAAGAPTQHGAPPEEGPSREARERAAAWRRGEQQARERAEGIPSSRSSYTGRAQPAVVHKAFAVLAENVRDYAIFLMNAEGVITFWGEGSRLIKWWTKAETEGAHLRLLYPDNGAEDGTAESHLETAARTGEYVGEGTRIRRDGSTFWAGVTLTALRDEQGNLLGFTKVTRDLTAQRAAEAVLHAAGEAAEEGRRQAAAANRAKGLFLAAMSHEIRTPINAIMGYTELLTLRIGGPLTAQQEQHLERIQASSRHLLGVIDEVLDFSRLEADRVTVQRLVARLAEPVREAVAMVQVQAEATGVAIANAVSGAMAGTSFWGDEERVRQILVILLSNAVKFTPRGGRITLSVGTADQPSPGVEVEGSGPWVYVRVEDTGSGIPPDRLAAIFEPFEQADNSYTHEHGGTGLGLAIAGRLARLMGGDIVARSEFGVGAAFFLWLPAAPGEQAAPSASGKERVAKPTVGALQELRDAIHEQLERILHAYIARLRSDAATPSAHAVPAVELEDHLATFLSDTASTLAQMDLAAGGDSETLRDGVAIQRTIAEHHGRQRFRLGWSEAEIRRELVILREELCAAVRRRVHRADLEAAIEVLVEFTKSAERTSLEGYRRAAEAEREAAGG